MHSEYASCGTRPLTHTSVQGDFQEGQYWSTDDPYHYVRLVKGSPQGDVLLVGGHDHHCGAVRPSLPLVFQSCDFSQAFSLPAVS